MPTIELYGSGLYRDLYLNNRKHQVVVLDRERINDTYDYQKVVLRGSRRFEGGLFTLPPLAVSNNALILEKIRCQDTIVFGGGTILLARPGQSEVEQHTLVSMIYPKKVIEYSQGTVVGYKAGARGLTILGIYTPEPKGNWEQTIPVDQQVEFMDKLVPPLSYWEKYHSL